MNSILEYKGYSGSVETSVTDECLYGKILFINDTITYEADTMAGLKTEFMAAVNDYIETCQEIGKEPQKPFKGSFNVRISPELHRSAALEAYKQGISLNELTFKAIDVFVNKSDKPVNFEHHDHHHYHYEQIGKKVQFRDTFENIGAQEWTVSSKIMSN